VQGDGAEDPHDGGEQKEADGEHGVVGGGLGGAAVAAAVVAPEDGDADGHGDAGDDEQGDLRPGLLAAGPGREVVALRQLLGRVEDREGRAEHGEHDQRAGEVGAAQEELGDADAGLDFLHTDGVSITIRMMMIETKIIMKVMVDGLPGHWRSGARP